jgi:hypothetical protein
VNATARADAYRRQRGHTALAHREASFWVDEDGTRGMQCACGTYFDGFARADVALLNELFASHVATASMTPRQLRRHRHKANRDLKQAQRRERA